MICIFSQSFREHSTEAVMLWLESWGVPHCRLNADDLHSAENGAVLSFKDGEAHFEWQYGGRRIRASEVTVAWYRRWSGQDLFAFDPVDVFGNEQRRTFNTVATTTHLAREARAVGLAVFQAFDHAVWLNPPQRSGLNKLLVLAEAQRCGLDTPATLVTSDPDEVARFGGRHRRLVTKCASDLTTFVGGEHQSLVPATTTVALETLKRDWRGGFPTLVQEQLLRAYELRVFYLDGVCTTFAYVFTNDGRKQADGRRGASRATLYELPQGICAALQKLMQRLGLDVGCIDMVRTKDDRWVFLEVNPTGQYWGEALFCNERLEKQIALALVRRLHAGRPGPN